MTCVISDGMLYYKQVLAGKLLVMWIEIVTLISKILIKQKGAVVFSTAPFCCYFYYNVVYYACANKFEHYLPNRQLRK